MEEAKVVASQTTAMATMDNPPEAVLIEAKKAAAALQDVIKGKPHPVIMNGEQYCEFDDWQLLGRFYGITAGEVGEPEYVSLDGVKGFKATAVALYRGREISRATAYCLSDEEKWRDRTKYAYVYVCRDGSISVEDPGPDAIVWEPNPNKPGKRRPQKRREVVGVENVPLFQLASMAQTRANAKALRNVLSWVVVLAGYKPTPAEEMDGIFQREETPQVQSVERAINDVVSEINDATARLSRKDEDDEPDWVGEGNPEPEREPERGVPSAKSAPCPQCGKSAMPSKWAKKGATHYCVACKLKFDPNDGAR